MTLAVGLVGRASRPTSGETLSGINPNLPTDRVTQWFTPFRWGAGTPARGIVPQPQSRRPSWQARVPAPPTSHPPALWPRLRHPDPTGREGARRRKRLSPELEADSPVAAVYDRRPSVEDSRRGSATPFHSNGGHRPPLQNTVWAQRDSTGAGCLSRLPEEEAWLNLPPEISLLFSRPQSHGTCDWRDKRLAARGAVHLPLPLST